MHIIQRPLFDFEKFIGLVKEEERLVIVLEGLDAEKLLAALDGERWTGRKGHSIRGMWAALIAGVVHQSPSVAGVVRLLKTNKAVREVCGFAMDKIPDEDALGRFLKKLVIHEKELEECFESMVEQLRHLFPGFGKKLEGDSTDIVAWSKGHRPSLQTGMPGGEPRMPAMLEGRQRVIRRVKKKRICTTGSVTNCICS